MLRSLFQGRARPCRRTVAQACAVVFLVFAGCLRPAAADYPDRPITLVVPWPAAGTTDLAARRFSEYLGKQLGVSIVVENRPGATGIVGSSFVAKAAPDGYTLLLASAETHAINPYTYSKLSYNPEQDFVSIAAFAINPYALVARQDFPAENTRDLVEAVRRQPGKFTYSSAGLGSASQIVMEMFKKAEGLDVLHVPYQGEAPGVTALMGGQVDFMVLPAGRAMVLRESGKLKVFAVTLPQRFAGMPEVPTFKEEGFDAIQIANWFALVAPKGTPANVLGRLEKGVDVTVRNKDTAAGLAKLGLAVFEPMPQPRFAAFVGQERTRWGSIIERAGIRAQQ